MKKTLQLQAFMALSISAVLIFISCKKDVTKTPDVASLTLVNAVVGGMSVKQGSNISSVLNNGFSRLTFLAGENDLYVWPISDSSHPYFTQTKFNAENRAVYSLFICGSAAAPEGILIKDNIPYRQDSTAGIRFINLSPNSSPLNITLASSPTVNEITGLAYKQYTDFISYPGLYNSSYTFQVRDASNNLLTSFRFTSATVPRFANITLVIRGMVRTTPAIGITRVNNDR